MDSKGVWKLQYVLQVVFKHVTVHVFLKFFETSSLFKSLRPEMPLHTVNSTSLSYENTLHLL